MTSPRSLWRHWKWRAGPGSRLEFGSWGAVALAGAEPEQLLEVAAGGASRPGSRSLVAAAADVVAADVGADWESWPRPPGQQTLSPHWPWFFVHAVFRRAVGAPDREQVPFASTGCRGSSPARRSPGSRRRSRPGCRRPGSRRRTRAHAGAGVSRPCRLRTRRRGTAESESPVPFGALVGAAEGVGTGHRPLVQRSCGRSAPVLVAPNRRAAQAVAAGGNPLAVLSAGAVVLVRPATWSPQAGTLPRPLPGPAGLDHALARAAVLAQLVAVVAHLGARVLIPSPQTRGWPRWMTRVRILSCSMSWVPPAEARMEPNSSTLLPGRRLPSRPSCRAGAR